MGDRGLRGRSDKIIHLGITWLSVAMVQHVWKASPGGEELRVASHAHTSEATPAMVGVLRAYSGRVTQGVVRLTES